MHAARVCTVELVHTVLHRVGVVVKLRGTLQLGAEAVDKHMEQGCYIGNTTESFLRSFSAPPYNAAPPLLFPSPLFLHGFLPLFYACAPLCPSPSLTVSASPSVPAWRYIPSPLAAFTVPGDAGGKVSEKRVREKDDGK